MDEQVQTTVKRYGKQGLQIAVDDRTRIILKLFHGIPGMVLGFRLPSDASGREYYQCLALGCRGDRRRLTPYAKRLYDAAVEAGLVQPGKSYHDFEHTASL